MFECFYLCKLIAISSPFIFRQQLERLPRRPVEASKTTASTAAPSSTDPQSGAGSGGSASAGGSSSNSLFLLSRLLAF